MAEQMTGDELRKALADLGITARDFAKDLQRYESTVSAWVNNKQPIPRYVQIIIAERLAVKSAQVALCLASGYTKKNACTSV